MEAQSSKRWGKKRDVPHPVPLPLPILLPLPSVSSSPSHLTLTPILILPTSPLPFHPQPHSILFSILISCHLHPHPHPLPQLRHNLAQGQRIRSGYKTLSHPNATFAAPVGIKGAGVRGMKGPRSTALLRPGKHHSAQQEIPLKPPAKLIISKVAEEMAEVQR